MSSSRPNGLADLFVTAPNTPLNLGRPLEPPRASYLSSAPETAASLRDSYAESSDNASPLVQENKKRDTIAYDQESTADPGLKIHPSLGGLCFGSSLSPSFTAVVLAVVLPVYFVVIKPHNYSTNGASAGESGSRNPTSPPGIPMTGGNGSLITKADGTTPTYLNSFGGIWVDNPNDPFNNSAYRNSWTPPLNSSWTWGVDKIYGVNIGGLFVLEPFITPALWERYPGAVDEWTLSTLVGADTASGRLQQIETHYSTFIDIAEIAGAGLNWIRLPVPFWAIEKWDFEPFLEKVCWPYILRVLQWARKYGIRVNLDLHTIPGSQNGTWLSVHHYSCCGNSSMGYNHSGKGGPINFLNGVMGLANPQRALDYIRIITEFISQPEWADVVPVFSIVNEPWSLPLEQTRSQRFVQSPLWSYQLGLQNGWIPTDPRTAVGTYAALGVTGPQFDGVYQAYQTGGPGAGTIVASSVTSYGQYPPTPINGLPLRAIQSLLPTYTSTTAVTTLPPPIFSPSPFPSVSTGNGWFDSGDTTGLAPTQVQGGTTPVTTPLSSSR
ncbi:glycoside hydrolase superfamily [Suillus americanus]|nr:glycoside hydrolase superfamily [Suillus americanus]